MKVDKKTIQANIVDEIINTVKYAGVSIIFLLIFEYSWMKKIVFVYLIILFVKIIIESILEPIRYKNYEYQFDEDLLTINSGVFIKTEKTVPIKRMQHIEVSQTIGSRIFNKYQIAIHTSGGSTFIGFLNENEAYRLRDELRNFVKDNKLEILDIKFSSTGVEDNGK